MRIDTKFIKGILELFLICSGASPYVCIVLDLLLGTKHCKGITTSYRFLYQQKEDHIDRQQS